MVRSQDLTPAVTRTDETGKQLAYRKQIKLNKTTDNNHSCNTVAYQLLQIPSTVNMEKKGQQFSE
jgi:hypothetical protein